jgi:phosphonate transport system substrate-binding protein
MKLTEKIIILVLVVVPVVLFSMQCASSTEKKPDKQAQVQTQESPANYPKVLRIAWSPSIQGGEIQYDNKQLDAILSQKLGIPVESSVLTNYVAIITGLVSGQIDCSMVNPLGYVLAKQKYDIDVIAKVVKDGSTEYYSQILVNNNSGIQTFTDLKGKKFAFVDRTSTSGHLFARTLMIKNGIDPAKDFLETPPFVGSHDKVAIDVMNGVFDAGATFQDVRDRLKDEYPEIMTKTSVIAVAGPIPNEMFCVSSQMDPGFKKALTDALIEISKGVEIDGKLVKPFYEMDKIEEIVPATDQDYDIVRDVIKNLDIDLMAEEK